MSKFAKVRVLHGSTFDRDRAHELLSLVNYAHREFEAALRNLEAIRPGIGKVISNLLK